MPRKPRQLSNTGIYHIVLRGVSSCCLFEDASDFYRFLDLLRQSKVKHKNQILAYCLMDNHVHLLLREETTGSVFKAMQGLLSQYASWFNRKYHRSGALIANRYKSEGIESDRHLMAAIRYIHQNPLNAHMVEKLERYRWSSYRDYLKDRPENTDTRFILDNFSHDHYEAVKLFIAFHQTENSQGWQEPGDVKINDVLLREMIFDSLEGANPNMIIGLPKPQRNDLIRRLRDNGLSTRQIERITGISRGVISRCV